MLHCHVLRSKKPCIQNYRFTGFADIRKQQVKEPGLLFNCLFLQEEGGWVRTSITEVLRKEPPFLAVPTCCTFLHVCIVLSEQGEKLFQVREPGLGFSLLALAPGAGLLCINYSLSRSKLLREPLFIEPVATRPSRFESNVFDVYRNRIKPKGLILFLWLRGRDSNPRPID